MITNKQINWANIKVANSNSFFARIFMRLYRLKRLRKFLLNTIARLEGGRIFSKTIREIFISYHGVHIGEYSYGSCFDLGVLPWGTVIGRYCSIADGLRVYRRNHRLDSISQHPFFFNSNLGLIENDLVGELETNPLIIANDVWIGSNVTILPSCRKIGEGAVIGAGSIVTKDVAAYSIVAGNPAKFVKFRFSEEIQFVLQKSKWWELSITELLSHGYPVFNSLDDEALDFLSARFNNDEFR